MAVKIIGTTVIDDTRKVITGTSLYTGLNGVYSDFHPDGIDTITTAIDFHKPIMSLAMTGNVTFTTTNWARGATSTLLLDTSASGHTPTFPSEVLFGVTPTWSNSRHWQITFTCTGTSDVRATAIGFDEPGAVSSSFSNWDMTTSQGWVTNSYGTSGNPWAAVYVSFQRDDGNNRIKIVQGKGNSINGTNESTFYANYTGLTGISSVEAQYNVQSQACGGSNCSTGYSYGPTPPDDSLASGTYYTVPSGPGQLFFGWQCVSTSSDSGSTQVQAFFNSANPDFRIKIVCSQGTFYSTSEVNGGTLSLSTNWGSMPAF